MRATTGSSWQLSLFPSLSLSLSLSLDPVLYHRIVSGAKNWVLPITAANGQRLARRKKVHFLKGERVCSCIFIISLCISPVLFSSLPFVLWRKGWKVSRGMCRRSDRCKEDHSSFIVFKIFVRVKGYKALKECVQSFFIIWGELLMHELWKKNN